MSIAESKVDLRGATSASKSKFRNHILKKADAATYVNPKNAVWIYDVGKFVRCQAPAASYRLYFDKLIKSMAPPKDAKPSAVHFVIDKYIDDSTKTGARKSRGEDKSIQINITGLGQSMPTTSDDWHSALSNSTTKRSLYSLFVKYLKSGTAPLIHPTIVNDEDDTYMIATSGNVTELFVCNHEEADTRMIYHASLQESKNVVLVANDSDVLFLGGYACALDKSRNWFYNYEAGTYADLAKFAEYYGDSCLYLPMFHSITGCDTTSYFHYRGKTIPWNRALKNPSSLLLIKDLGKEITPSETTLVECMEFVRIYVYSGLPNEDLVTTNGSIIRSSSRKKDEYFTTRPELVAL